MLTSGGHNAGIVSEPGDAWPQLPGDDQEEDAAYVGPDKCLTKAPQQEGSWWTEWGLAHRAVGRAVEPPAMGLRRAYAPFPDAPGSYVLQR